MRKGRKGQASSSIKSINVELLDGEARIIESKVSSTLKEIFDAVCQHLSIEDTDLFGLAIKDETTGEFEFQDQELKVSKLIRGRRPLPDSEICLSLYLRVKFYVNNMAQISDDKSRYYYYHQLRQNFIAYPILYPDDRCFLLASYTVLAASSGSPDVDIDQRDIFPAWVRAKHGKRFIANHLPSLVSQLSYLTVDRAERLYVDELSIRTPICYNQHLFGVHMYPTHCSSGSSASGRQKEGTPLYLGFGYKTIELYEVTKDQFLRRHSSYLHSQIDSLRSAKRKLEVILEDGETVALLIDSERRAQYLMSLLNACSQFYSTSQTNEATSSATPNSIPYTEKQAFRESYIYSDEADLEWEQKQSNISSMLSLTYHPRAAGVLNKKDRRNRFSLVSTASSTTSGIVSDKPCLSYYSSQEDLLNASQITSTGSRDSLLEPSQFNKSRPVQRAISEPSKKFEQLRDLKVRRPVIPRATSNDTVGTAIDVADPIYENVVAVRSRLLAAAQAKQNKLSPRVSLEGNFQGMLSRPVSNAYSQGALNHLSQSQSQLARLHHKSSFSSQYSMLKSSPSMEQLLEESNPPPSYNEHHKKMACRMFLNNDNGPRYGALPRKSTISTDQPTRYLDKAARQDIPIEQSCQCKTTSHPEIDKLRADNSVNDLPLIMALCNDKDLQSDQCSTCDSNPATDNNNISSRPKSWHSESFILSSSLPLSHYSDASNC